MAVESDDDRAVFIDADEFGAVATHTPNGGSPTAVTGLFDDPYLSLDIGGEVQFASSEPRFTCRTADLPAGAAEGDELVVGSTTYKITDIQPDGSGMTRLALTKAS